MDGRRAGRRRGRGARVQVGGGFEVDCVWREARVAVELDARSTHATLPAFERDRERDRIRLTAGWHPVRVTWRQLELTPSRLEADLRRLLGAATLAA
ncbi:MAG: hypothetical protein ICV69_15815 [Thermoleophilaceae bacterium]|nr:hypothetical protein [Thermoleophilaceae bacterium]